jgi:heme/copper-type cytochrome/quinol oxidase subunit 3
MDTERAIASFGMGDESRLAMILFLISEGLFFIFLIIAYAFFHESQKTGPTAANSQDPLTTGAFTVALLSSSFTMWRAEKSYARGHIGAFRNWLGATIVLGAIFMFGQGREYLGLYRANVTVSRNVFGSSFFTLTGFHGLHVIFGLITLLILLALAFQRSERPQESAVRTIALYWHFVDWVWVVIFSVVYLWAIL